MLRDYILRQLSGASFRGRRSSEGVCRLSKIYKYLNEKFLVQFNLESPLEMAGDLFCLVG